MLLVAKPPAQVVLRQAHGTCAPNFKNKPLISFPPSSIFPIIVSEKIQLPEKTPKTLVKHEKSRHY